MKVSWSVMFAVAIGIVVYKVAKNLAAKFVPSVSSYIS